MARSKGSHQDNTNSAKVMSTGQPSHFTHTGDAVSAHHLLVGMLPTDGHRVEESISYCSDVICTVRHQQVFSVANDDHENDAGGAQGNAGQHSVGCLGSKTSRTSLTFHRDRIPGSCLLWWGAIPAALSAWQADGTPVERQIPQMGQTRHIQC